jgi:hypothetical protein
VRGLFLCGLADPTPGRGQELTRGKEYGEIAVLPTRKAQRALCRACLRSAGLTSSRPRKRAREAELNDALHYAKNCLPCRRLIAGTAAGPFAQLMLRCPLLHRTGWRFRVSNIFISAGSRSLTDPGFFIHKELQRAQILRFLLSVWSSPHASRREIVREIWRSALRD